MELRQFDIKTAFLYGELEVQVYLEQPEYLTMAVVVYVGRNEATMV
jgi:hypothetical protein